jgi:hypothetical protein
MIKYWYCGNIPPRPLDEKVKDLDGWDGKDKKKNFGPIKDGEGKNCLKIFHKTLVAVCECGRLEVGRLEGGRLG